MVENEIPYIRWDEFRQMTPTILQLEVDRLGTLIDGTSAASDVRNTLVRARYELNCFLACVRETGRETVVSEGAAHLQTAILAIALLPAVGDDATRTTLDYVADRLSYVNARIPLIY